MAQREVAQLKSKQIELSKAKKSLDSTVKSQKEEIKKMKGNQQHLKKQFEHDIRKGEREMGKLKEKLVQVLHIVYVNYILMRMCFQSFFAIER